MSNQILNTAYLGTLLTWEVANSQCNVTMKVYILLKDRTTTRVQARALLPPIHENPEWCGQTRNEFNKAIQTDYADSNETLISAKIQQYCTSVYTNL